MRRYEADLHPGYAPVMYYGTESPSFLEKKIPLPLVGATSIGALLIGSAITYLILKYLHRKQAFNFSAGNKSATTEMSPLEDISFTFRIGYMPDGTKYDDLVKVFGEPDTDFESDSKIKAEWRGKINGEVFTIYDYDSTVPVEDVTRWHIGGKKPEIVEDIIEYFNKNK
jgi:hypothetical protein